MHGTAPPQSVGVEGSCRTNRSTRNGTSARLILASLNMNGYTTASGTAAPCNKWMLINQLMRDEKLSILALQETHLTDDRITELRTLFGQYISIWAGHVGEDGTRAGGVCFVTNKRRMRDEGCVVEQLIPGRAMLLRVPWVNGRNLEILNVYAPNDAGENAAFWKTLRERPGCKPDVILGDFNVVEDPIDRIPARSDPTRATAELNAMCREMRLKDGWRETHAGVREFTYMHGATASQSRLDRIYATATVIRDASVWTIAESGVPTDHKLVTVSMANRAEPFRGKGRWSLPLHLLDDGPLKTQLKDIGAMLITELAAISVRSEENNPQTAYAVFKQRVRDAARNRAKEKIPAMRKRAAKLRLDLQATLNPPNGGELTQDQRVHAAILQDKITALEAKSFDGKRRRVEEAHWETDERISKQWIKKYATCLP
ncbi:Endonuclease/exonuclease/phosphatase, partial [Lenzites betulinus]